MNWLENLKKDKIKRCQKVIVNNKKYQNKGLLHHPPHASFLIAPALDLEQLHHEQEEEEKVP